MDYEKIKELASGYIGWDKANLCVATRYDVVTDFLQWLSQTHCIVEKSQARELAKLTLDNDQSVDYGLIDGLTDWVLENFSEEYREEAEK